MGNAVRGEGCARGKAVRGEGCARGLCPGATPPGLLLCGWEGGEQVSPEYMAGSVCLLACDWICGF